MSRTAHPIATAAAEPPMRADAMRRMALALSPQELAAWLDDLQQTAPAATFRAALEAVSAQLDGPRWDALAQALHIPQVTVPVLAPA